MQFANLLSRFYFEPWGIRPDKHAAMGRELQRHLRGDAPTVGPTLEGEPVVPQMQTAAGVAIIPVHGVLGKHLSFLELYCGGCDYDHVMEMAAQADADPYVHTAVFDFNTPGGMSVGNTECAGVIAGMSKETIAFSDMQCCSNGYLLASQCDTVLCAGSGIIGCIGTYIAALDTSREWEMEGWKLELFRSGPLKAAGIDGKAWTPEERADFQRIVDEANGAFVDAIRARRPQIAAETMQGQWFSGRDGVRLGLADDLCNDLGEAVGLAMIAATL